MTDHAKILVLTDIVNALREATEREYNSFEPDNQSARYHRWNEILKTWDGQLAKAECPGPPHCWRDWTGGESERVKCPNCTDAQPAEAATRENGDLLPRLRKLEEYLRDVDGNKSADTVKDALAFISTHQQQGADSELVRKLRLAVSGFPHAECSKLFLEAADALSRAPQPEEQHD